MRLLFVGSEEEYEASTIAREDGEPFSLFFCAALSADTDASAYDAVVVPALRFLSGPNGPMGAPLIASGSSDMADECFDHGCSDFIRAPWTGAELRARVAREEGARAAFGDAAVVGRRLVGPSGSIRLDGDKRRLLLLIGGNRGRPVPRSAIATALGIQDRSGRAVDMRIARLRASLRAVGALAAAENLRCGGGGYHF